MRPVSSEALSVPVARSLTAEAYRARVAETGRAASTALTGREPIAGGARLRSAAKPGVAERLEGFIAAESRCCPSLSMELQRADGGHVLEVTGAEQALPIIEELFA